MSTPHVSGFESGRAAADRVATDPFWSVLRRRHPDVDIVLLPPEPDPAPRPDGAPDGDAPVVRSVGRDDEAAIQQAEAARLWEACGGSSGAGSEPPTTSSRWVGGRVAGATRHETTWRADGIDPVAALTAVQRAGRVLQDEGWHVLVPEVGLPRVLAGRGEGAGRVELQLVHSPATSRLVMRLRAADVVATGPAGQSGSDEGEGRR